MAKDQRLQLKVTLKAENIPTTKRDMSEQGTVSFFSSGDRLQLVVAKDGEQGLYLSVYKRGSRKKPKLLMGPFQEFENLQIQILPSGDAIEGVMFPV